MRMRFLSIIFLVIFCSGSIGVLSAQEFQQQQQAENVSDQELKAFSDAFTDVQSVQENLNGKINSLIEESIFTQERFNKLYSAFVNEDQQQLSQLSSDEKEAFNTLVEKINSLQQQQQETMIETVQDNGLSVEEFNKIVAAIQQDPELQSRFQEIHQN